ncbi:MAG: hypothetical protein KGN79_03305 [Acidobacteriota bacterium]|nr:hypothetical protein [Acidobacteriota bacterium]
MTVIKKSLLGKTSTKSAKPAVSTPIKAASSSKLVSPKMVMAKTMQTTKATLRTTRVAL